MSENPKVLVAVPYHEKKKYCLSALFQGLSALTYPNKEIVVRFDPSEYGSEDAVKKQREFFRKMALEKGFDYLYFFGADTIPPADVIERLLSSGEKIIGGVYWGRHNADNGSPEGAVAWRHDMEQAEQSALFNGEMRLDQDYPSIVPVDGMGMDCVLIHREVLEKISWLDWKQNDDDYPFYDRAKENGYKVFIDISVQCRHYFTENGYCYKAAVVDISKK